MVRLRSERWYSGDGQRRVRRTVADRSSGSRKLMSLCFLLALVVLMMQKAADPRHVSNAFRALGVPLDGASVESAPLDGPSESTTGDAANSESEKDDTGNDETELDAGELRWLATCQDLAPRMLDEFTDGELIAFARTWFGFEATTDELANAGSRESKLALPFEKAAVRLDELQTLVDADASSDWNEQLTRFGEQWNRIEAMALAADASGNEASSLTKTELDPALRSVLTDVLDSRLMTTMRDASPWSTSESTAFWRMLQRASTRDDATSSPQPPDLISTLSLESQSKSYKGKVVRYRGAVHRVDKVTRRDAGLSIDGYQVLWLRGEDEATQPVAVYAVEPLGAEFAEMVRPEESWFPLVEVTGFSAKRLAYGSESGVQVAPTLFASEIRLLSSSAPQSPMPVQEGIVQNGLFALLLGGLLAGVILIPIVAARRRSRNQPGTKWKSTSRVRHGLLLFAVVCGCTGWMRPRTAIGQEDVPPWVQADSVESGIMRLFQSRVGQVFGPGDLLQLRQYVDAETSDFPDSTLKALHALNQLGWKRTLDAAPEMPLGVDEWQMEAWQLSGLARLAMPIVLSDDQEIWYQESRDTQLFRLEVELFDSASPQNEPPSLTTVFCRHLPKMWLSAAKLRQPVRVEGFAIRASATSDPICVLSDTVVWSLANDDVGIAIDSATETEWEPRLPDHLLRLGQLGWNLTWQDQVRAASQKRLEDSEAEPFYAFLRVQQDAAKRDAATETASVDPMDALADPSEAFAKSIRWNVRLVNGSIVKVQGDEAQTQLGAEQYYQYDGFVDIGQRRVRYQVDGDDVNFEREFPVTVVTKELMKDYVPPEARSGEITTWSLGKFVEVEGTFYRLWSFQSKLMQDKSDTARQAAPLIVAKRFTATQSPIRASSMGEIGWFGYALCLATVVILGAILFFSFKPDHGARHRRIRRERTHRS